MNHDMSRAAIENGPDIDEGPDDIEPGDRCHICEGWGGWTQTVEAPDGRDIEIDHDCHHCDATGVEP